MRSMTLLFTIFENNNNIAITAIAPINAAINIAKKPVNETVPAVILPPNSSITNATPRLAPLLIPKIDGPASGLQNAVCKSNPLTAKAPPHNIAVKACGRRVSNIMYFQLSLTLLLPQNMSMILFIGIFTAP